MTLLSKKNWIYDDIGIDITDSNALLEYLLFQRGVKDKESFFTPELKNIPTFEKLYNSTKAAKEIVKAVKEKKKIFIHGDFDADGVSATAILWEFIYKELSQHLKIPVEVKPYIPSRVDEGYGLSESSIDAMRKEGARLIITVDCGIRDKDIIEKYAKEGLEIIVTDHHEPPHDFIDPTYTVVHPMYPGHEYPFQKICGSTVSFLLTQAIRCEIGHDYDINENTPGLDLVALATVTDMMPLIDVNRVFVKYGLGQMIKTPRLGIRALFNLAQVDISKLDSYHFGFVLGPRINAAGRIGHAMDALRLVLSPNEKSALEYSSQLHNLNLRRQDNTQEALKVAQTQLGEFENDKLIFLVGEGWHEGIIGLVASKIFEKTGKPTIVATILENEIKASARSIPDFNITHALDHHSKYLVKYGGHAQAAGLVIKKEMLSEFKTSIIQFANETIAEEALMLGTKVDLKLNAEQISYELYKTIDQLKPYGFGNMKPVVELDNVVVYEKKTLSGGKHLKLKVRQGNYEISLLMFGCDEDIELINEGDNLSVIGYLSLNEWNNKVDVEIQVKGYKFVE